MLNTLLTTICCELSIKKVDRKIKLKSSYLEEKTDFTFYEILTRVSAYFEEVDSDFNGQITFNEFITQIPTMLEIHHRSGLSRHMCFCRDSGEFKRSKLYGILIIRI